MRMGYIVNFSFKIFQALLTSWKFIILMFIYSMQNSSNSSLINFK